MKRKEVVVFGLVDLTPYYLYEEDVKEFHQTYRLLCNRYDPSLTHSSTTNDLYGALYEKMKAQCDDYFYIPHRREHRGVGGLFFDDLHSFPSYLSPVTPSEPSNKDDEMLKVQEFMLDFGKELMPSFQRICSRRHHLPYTERQKQWQQIRRGRYVEFNLVYDRGVKFGLVPGGRIEAVLVSCPPVVQWSELEHLSGGESGGSVEESSKMVI